MKNQKEFYFKFWIFRFYLIIEPDEVLPFVEVAVAVETRRMKAWMRKIKNAG